MKLDMKIVDTVYGVVVNVDGQNFLRMVAPTMFQAIPKQPYLWYQMMQEGWLSCDPSLLEAAFKEIN